MRRLLLIALAAVGATGPSVYSLLGGSVGFTAPDGWREVARTDGDTSSFVAFVVPRPAADPSAPAGNVMIDIVVSHGHQDLKTYSDGKIAQVAGGPGNPAIVESRYLPDSSREILWSGQLRGTPYVLWDRHAVRDSLYIDVRTAIPLAYARDSGLEARYEAKLDSMLSSICAGTSPLFPGPATRCPNVKHVLPFSPAENEDGARFVWLIERQTGFPRPYVAAKDLPNSSDYRKVQPDSARAGDIVWWPTLVGIYDADSKGLLLLEGQQPLASYIQRLGQPRYYRRLVPQ